MQKIPRKISKLFFSDLSTDNFNVKDLKNLFFFKTLKFIAFSDSLTAEDYNKISDVLIDLGFGAQRDTLVSVGKDKPPFGFLFNDFSDKVITNELLNSAQFCFHFVKNDLTIRNIIANVLVGTIPLINFDAWYLKNLGLQDFCCAGSLKEKIKDFENNYPFWLTRVNRLAAKYKNKIDN